MRVEPLDASADLPTAQSAPSASASAVRAAAQKRKREDPRDDSDVGSPTDTAAAAPKPSSCVHEVAIPEGWEGDLDALHNPTYDGPRAKAYPFTLDAFQETSVAVLERNESVMVAAHTSAGKTVVAEYAIAMAFRDKQRVIYTSPLKALSNQKFRELTEEFGGEDGSQVGLMTGDVSINPNATCVVMTTEVLRSMLYRGSDISREVKWIIFDEVHYMRDRERGVIWEESIIFAPPGAKMVFLSATLPNAKQFADWVTHMHKHPCHVVYTDHRPTPLVHYCFPKGGRKPIQVINERREFDDRNFALLVDELERGEADRKSKRQNVGDGGGRGRGGGGRGGGGRGRGGGGGRGRGGGGGGGGGDGGEDMYNLFKHILSKELLPTIVFSFSRRECEEHPKALTKLNFTTDAEKETIQEIYDNALLCMSEEDRELKAVQEILPILRRGIGIHHSGLLPIVKELVEILFGESLIKVLFATETFAMGLNMPARCVVFTAFKKFDGENMRVVAPGEYTQMSGRAGRRGKDPCGTCIMMVDEKMGKEDVTSMVLGEPQPLNSEFKLTYYQILNLLKRASGTVNTEYVIARSFHQFQHAVNVPAWRARDSPRWRPRATPLSPIVTRPRASTKTRSRRRRSVSANCGPSFSSETTPLQREFFDRAASFASSPTPSTGDGASWSAVIRPRKPRTCYCTTPRARNEAWWRRQVARGAGSNPGRSARRHPDGDEDDSRRVRVRADASGGSSRSRELRRGRDGGGRAETTHGRRSRAVFGPVARTPEFRILRRWSSPNDSPAAETGEETSVGARGERARSFGPRVRKVGAVR